eukprot:c16326_g1_i2.p1 GENE.c16326_g1_i2~~c16326_g1_i2.p1  ORF type:complete len:103 (+),score=17.71 c16326_g1_i2:319-627(+)
MRSSKDPGRQLASFSNVFARGAQYLAWYDRAHIVFSDLPVKQPITCTKETTVQELVLMMSANKIHRLYVVNDQNKPVGVVTILDVLAQLVESPSADEEILVE